MSPHIISLYKLLLSCLFIVVSTFLSAQVFDIKGRIVADSTNIALVGANIYLETTLDTSFVNHCVSEKGGEFLIKTGPGDFFLTISYIGYQLEYIPITVVNEDLILKDITLKPGTNEIMAVLIEADATIVKLLGDTTEFNASSFITNPDATADDLMNKMPGMGNKDGKAQAQGEEVKQVLVDGKPFFGDDPNAALKNIPAEMIDKIQVFDQQSEQSQFTGFDDGNTTKTMNIITKEEFRNGYFGNIYAGYGDRDRYQTGGSINKFNDDQRITLMIQSNNINQQNFSSEDLVGVVSNSSGRSGGRGGRRGGSRGGNAGDFLVNEQGGITETDALGINYSDELGTKMKISGSYFLNKTDNSSITELFQEYFSVNTDNQLYTESEGVSSKNLNHRMNIRFDYDINEKNSIRIGPRISLQNNSGLSNTNGITSILDTLLSGSSNCFDADNDGWNISNFIMWKKQFDKEKRTLSIYASQNYQNTDAESYLLTNTFFIDEDVLDSINQQSFLAQFENTNSARIMYTEPMGENTMLQLSYSPSLSTGESEKKTYNYDPLSDSNSLFDTLLSNVADTWYLSQEAGAGIRYSKGKHRIGVDVEYQISELQANQDFPAEINITKPYSALLPSFNYRWRMSREKQFRFSYRTGTSIPNISQLQEVLNNQNPLQLSIGNSDLDQSYEHRFFLKYNSTDKIKGKSFFAMIRANIEENAVGNSVYQSISDTIYYENIQLNPGTQIDVPVNLSGKWNVSAYAVYGIPVKKLKSNLSFSISGNFQRNPGLVNGRKSIVDNPSWETGVVLSSNISEKIDFTLSSSTSLNYSINSLNSSSNTQYLNQISKVKLYYNFWKNLILRAEWSSLIYSGFNDQIDANYNLVGLSLSSKFLKNNNGEVILSVYDLLKQNQSVSRITTESYIQDQYTQVLRQYFMVTFRYKIRAFVSQD